MRFCPSCRQEFESFATACPDCEVGLVDELPTEAPPPEVPPTTELFALDIDSAQAMLALIEAGGIPVVPGETSSDGHPILVIPSNFERSSRDLLESSAEFEPVGDETKVYRYLGPEPEEETPPDLTILSDSVRRLAARGEEVIAPLLDIVRRAEGEPQKKAVLAISAMGPVGRSALARQAPILAREGRDLALFAVAGELRDRQVAKEELSELVTIAIGAGSAPEIRVIALHALGRFPLPDLAPPIVDLLGDEDAQVREAADEALCNLLDDDVGFEPDAPGEEQAAAIDRWRAILTRR